MYRIGFKGVFRLSDNAFIPEDSDNQLYVEYLLWLEDGNTPEPILAEDFAEAKRLLLLRVSNNCENCMTFITSQYPQIEMGSWPEQLHEAKSFIADSTAKTPMLSCIANERELSVAELAGRVITKANQFSILTGTAVGRRQVKEDQIIATTTLDELEAIDLTISIMDMIQ